MRTHKQKPENQALLNKLIISIFILILGWSAASCSIGLRLQAPDRCMDYVVYSLNAFAPLHFSNNPDREVNTLGYGRYEVISFVDYEDEHGVMVRANWKCEVLYTGNNYWKLENLEFIE
jgi:hypothetical protein